MTLYPINLFFLFIILFSITNFYSKKNQIELIKFIEHNNL